MNVSGTTAIVVDGLTKRYGELLAVNDVSFTVRQGEVFAFLGPNGAGKTTTVEIIETLRRPTAGRVSVLGMDVARQKRDILPRIGVLPQGFSSFDRLTVAESIRYYASLFSHGDVDVDGLMTLTSLTDKRDVQFKKLSGGLKQRLGIAIALVNDPEIVFLDEPTTGLDPHARREVWEVLMGLKSKGKVVFLTTHYMEEAQLLADTVAIIRKGKLAAMGSPNELIERHANYLSLTLSRANAAMQATIKAMGFETVMKERDTLRIRVSGSEDVRHILAGINREGSALPGIDVRKPNLEEVYLSLTGEALPDTALLQGAGR